MYEKSGSQFLRTTTGIKVGPDGSDESRFVMNLFNHLGSNKKTMWSFRLVLEGKIGKEIPESSRLEFLKNF